MPELLCIRSKVTAALTSCASGQLAEMVQSATDRNVQQNHHAKSEMLQKYQENLTQFLKYL